MGEAPDRFCDNCAFRLPASGVCVRDRCVIVQLRADLARVTTERDAFAKRLDRQGHGQNSG